MNDSVSGSSVSDGFCTPWNTIPIPNDAFAQSLLQNDTNIFFARYIIPCIIVVCFLSNAAFLFMVYRVNRMQTITNFYLVNIAIADLIFGCIAPSMYAYSVTSSPLFGNIPFDVNNPCFFTFYPSYGAWFVSVGGVTVVSFERFIAVCYPLRAHSMQSKSRTLAVTVGIWIFAITMGGLTVPRYGKTLKLCLIWPDGDAYIDMPTIFQTCIPMGTGKSIAIYTEIIEAASFFVALLVNAYFYGNIIYALSSRSVVGDEDSKQHAHTTQIRNQVARALVINGIVFFITQTPYRINNIDGLSKTFNGTGFLTKSQSDTLKVISRGFLYLNSAINSFIYAFSSSFYRHGFREAFSLPTIKRMGTVSKSFTASRSVSEKTAHTNI